MKTMILAALLALLAVPAFTGDTWGEDSARIEVSVIQEGPASGPDRSLVGGEPHYGTPPQCRSRAPGNPSGLAGKSSGRISPPEFEEREQKALVHTPCNCVVECSTCGLLCPVGGDSLPRGKVFC